MVISLRTCSAAMVAQAGQAGHVTVVVHDLAQQAGRIQPRRLAQIDHGLGVAGPLGGPRPPDWASSGKMWPGRARSRRAWSSRVDEDLDRARRGRPPLMPVVTPFGRIDAHGELRFPWLAVLRATIGVECPVPVNRSPRGGQAYQTTPEWRAMKLTA